MDNRADRDGHDRLRRAIVRERGVDYGAERPPIVALERSREGQLSLHSDDRLSGLLTQFASTRAPGSSNADEVWPAFEAYLAKHEHQFEEIALADAAVSATLDLATGRVVGLNTHFVAGLDQEISENVTRSVVRALSALGPTAARDIEACIGTELERGNYADAGAALLAANREGRLSLARGDKALVATLARIQPSSIAPEHRIEFATLRLATAAAAEEWTVAAVDAEYLLAGDAPRTAEQTASLRLILGLAAQQLGHLEAAVFRWRQVAEDAQADPGNRGWANINLSLSLDPTDVECQRYAEVAAGLFASVGDRPRVVGSRLRAAQSQAHRDAPGALAMLNGLVSSLDGEAVHARDLRGRTLVERARLAERFGDYWRAFDDAIAAAANLRGLVGAEGDLACALSIAAHVGRRVGQDVAPLLAEHAKLAPQAFDDHELRERVGRLAMNFDPEEATAIAEGLPASASPHLVNVLTVLIATHDARLDDARRLEMLEIASRPEREPHPQLPLLALPALAITLLRLGRKDRALAVCQEILELDPLSAVERHNAGVLLLELERYPEAVAFFRDEIGRWGALPGLRFRLGQAYLGAGNADQASTVFADLATGGASEFSQAAAEWFQRAKAAHGTVQLPRVVVQHPVTSSEWNDSLAEFSKHVKSQARMELWTKDEHGQRKWTPSPERVASRMLHNFLAGKFGDRIETFKEADAGAGRIDHYVVLRGGLRVIVELKMLGHGYTSTYAFSGTEQITHYMDNVPCRLGYLVLFDARTRDHGKTPDGTPTPNSVSVHFVDVRHTIKE